jgi:uncharacterized protein
MHIGILQFDLAIDSAQSLKDKRRVVRSIKDRLHRDHMVSVAEMEYLDVWNKAGLGLVACSRDATYLQGVLDAIVRKLETHPEARLEHYALDIVQAESVTADAVDEQGEPLWTEAERRDESPEESDDDQTPKERRA